MKVRFKKPVAVDYNDVNLNEVVSRSYDRNQVIEAVSFEDETASFYKLHFANGDTAIGVPKVAVDIIP